MLGPSLVSVRRGQEGNPVRIRGLSRSGVSATRSSPVPASVHPRPDAWWWCRPRPVERAGGAPASPTESERAEPHAVPMDWSPSHAIRSASHPPRRLSRSGPRVRLGGFARTASPLRFSSTVPRERVRVVSCGGRLSERERPAPWGVCRRRGRHSRISRRTRRDLWRRRARPRVRATSRRSSFASRGLARRPSACCSRTRVTSPTRSSSNSATRPASLLRAPRG